MELEYDMLVGADGVNSRVRKSLEENVPDFTVRQREVRTFVRLGASKFFAFLFFFCFDGGAYLGTSICGFTYSRRAFHW